MLSHLSVRDLVIVEQLSVELGPGLTVLTGETGAGKSILVDALSLALGARANSALVRAGAQRTEVTALFDMSGQSATVSRLQALELDEADGELHLRRTVSADGRSRAYVNGRPVPLQVMRELGATLVDVHGQHEHQSLMRAEVQREVLDSFGAHGELLASITEAYEQWSALNEERTRLAGEQASHHDRMELLAYQLQELDELGAETGEYAALLDEFKQLSQVGDFREACAAAGHLLLGDNDDGADSRIRAAAGLLSDLADPALSPISELLESARIQIEEAALSLRDMAEHRESDPERLANVEQRLERFQAVARKHQVRPAELPELHARLREQYEHAHGQAERALSVDQELVAASAAYGAADRRLGEARASAADTLAQAVTSAMQTLGMPGGVCEIAVSAVADNGKPRRYGTSQVEILVSANPGSAPQALARVASGGELSRISLALQVQLARGAGVPTLIFDEVDVGIGGGVAEIVGRQLSEVANSRQVVCITHLPQVASFGGEHLRVRKTAGKDSTSTILEKLASKERVEEIARMLGGQSLTARTRAHAREMLSMAAAAQGGSSKTESSQA